MRDFRIYLILLTLICASGHAQDHVISLKESIALALENNPDLRGVELAAERSKVRLKQAKYDIFPTLGANYNLGKSIGRSIDPFTNAYINKELVFSNATVNLDAPVFQGFRLLNLIRQQRLKYKASLLEVEEAERELILRVTLAYLQVLNNRDLVRLAKNRLESTSKQVERLETLFDEEVGNPADYSDIRGQFAEERTALIRAQSALEESVILLNRLLKTKDQVTAEMLGLGLAVEEYPHTPQEVYEEALEDLPGYEARALRVKASKKGVNAARSLYFPSVSLFGSLSTNYSSAAEVFKEAGVQEVPTGDFVEVGDERIPVKREELQFDAAPIPYQDQLENNLGSIVGIAVDIPIFRGFRAKHEVAMEKIAVQESIIALKKAELELEQAIKNSFVEMEAAYKRYHILQEQVEAYEESFRVTEIRFNSGVSTIVAYTISKNNLANARINLLNARYEYLLRTRILDYYRGIPFHLQ